MARWHRHSARREDTRKYSDKWNNFAWVAAAVRLHNTASCNRMKRGAQWEKKRPPGWKSSSHCEYWRTHKVTWKIALLSLSLSSCRCYTQAQTCCVHQVFLPTDARAFICPFTCNVTFLVVCLLSVAPFFFSSSLWNHKGNMSDQVTVIKKHQNVQREVQDVLSRPLVTWFVFFTLFLSPSWIDSRSAELIWNTMVLECTIASSDEQWSCHRFNETQHTGKSKALFTDNGLANAVQGYSETRKQEANLILMMRKKKKQAKQKVSPSTYTVLLCYFNTKAPCMKREHVNRLSMLREQMIHITG